MLRLSLGLIAAASAGFAAAQGMPGAPDKRSVGGVVTQPLSDANLKRSEIPPQLLAILDDPYSLKGIRRCRELIVAVDELNAVLGADLDAPVEVSRGQKRRNAAMFVTGGVISRLIPFRYLIREISGANRADNRYRAAIYAGVVRRGFLKGYGKSRGCRPPGSPIPLMDAPPPLNEEEMDR